MRVLYITYDGLLDPLGSSQILPYLYGLNDSSKFIFIISVEKSNRYKANYSALRDELSKKNIYWKPLLFSKKFGVLGKLWDFCKMYFSAIKLSSFYKIDTVHARGHVAAQVGSFLKLLFNIKFIFDFRGLWVDERVDKGGWNLDKNFDRAQYNFFKHKERKLLNHADHTIVLTNKVVKEVCKISDINLNQITVIPCCADFEHFSAQTNKTKAKIKKQLEISENSLVFGFLGSVGSMYLLEDYLRLIELIHLKYQSRDIEIFGLIITNDLQKAQDAKNNMLSMDLKEKTMVLSASREEVPKLLHSLDVLISFITSTYARQGASPTKIAESFSCGIPVISNKGIGDVEDQVNAINGGKIINDTSIESLKEITLDLDQILLLDRKKIRCKARELLSLDVAIERYKDVYSKINVIEK